MAEAYGVELPEISDGLLAIEMVAVVKCLNPEGSNVLQIVSSGGLNIAEATGMLLASSDTLREGMVSNFLYGDDPEEPDEEEE